LCEENHKRQVEAREQDLAAADINLPWRIRPCDLQKKLRKACGINCIPNKCLRQLLRRPLVCLTNLFNHCIRLSHFPKSWKEAKMTALPKPCRYPEFPQNLLPISLLSTTSKLFQKVCSSKRLQLRYSWILKKPLKLYGTRVCYIYV
jgi:hypothetical protein